MKFKKGDLVLVRITEEIARKMPVYFSDAKMLKGRIYCRMNKAKVPSYRIDFSEFVQAQVPAELVSELRSDNPPLEGEKETK